MTDEYTPKNLRHVERSETSPECQEIPHYIRDDGAFFLCFLQRGVKFYAPFGLRRHSCRLEA
ncbi:hypothetical protein BN59_01812 [Legionella massiliensis]|uniref:Uncharacterized protein n=1 Tax=Legionella massiliensis TaxID=1034943 RepID=A0A078L0F7_9GAMM|nr:hypothetical protein BN59_01812 [Legionella massiliensis]CEE13267.1 hypothetical protein BN1094_01812 [Legionella massiliensis]